MRFLNRVIFINSASVKYSEIELSGNVHLIGNQGAGKSTLLRAILFFYNADKTHLGISREHKNFDTFYFPKQNSYIIYEVVKENITYLIVAFKAQGRVAFRFIDSKYKRELFINSHGTVAENWMKIREKLGKDIQISKMISRYEEYRNVLYGNNKGLDPKFRKYALLESKQFQNIPRTIQNVFLNSKLDAEFIKETIIKSLNENEVKINLVNYSKNHLNQFEAEINAIKLWSKQNSRGEIVVRKQAEIILTNYSQLKFLKHERVSIVSKIIFANKLLEQQKPEVENHILEKEEKIVLQKSRIEKSDKLFYDSKIRLSKRIGILDADLDKIIKREDYYEKLNIKAIIERVDNKSNLEHELEEKKSEKQLLTSKYGEIGQKYKALILHATDNYSAFENIQNNNKLQIREEFSEFRDKINLEYQSIVEQINLQVKDDLILARNEIENKKNDLIQLSKRKIKIQYTQFYSKEIERLKEAITEQEKDLAKIVHLIEANTGKIKYLQKEWEHENRNITTAFNTELTELARIRKKLEEEINKIKIKLKNKDNSLFNWLNQNYPNWGASIGKLIDEDRILFKTDLSPKLVNESGSELFGVSLDLSKIEKTIKTIDDYQDDLERIEQQLKQNKDELEKKEIGQEKSLRAAKKKFHGKISDLKDDTINKEYEEQQLKGKSKKNKIEKEELFIKSKNEKKIALDKIEEEVSILLHKKELAIEALTKIENSLKRKIKVKEKEKQNLLDSESDKLKEKNHIIENLIAKKKIETKNRKEQLETALNSELSSKGVNTERIEVINKSIVKVTEELTFIDKNIFHVIEFQKDKRELFDKETEFLEEKKNLHLKLKNEIAEHESKKMKLKTVLDDLKEILNSFKVEFDLICKDQKKFSDFKCSEHYDLFESIQNEKTFKEISTTERVEKLINEFQSNAHKEDGLFLNLQTAVSKFTDHFEEDNIFKFKVKNTEKEEQIEFARNLKEFMDEDKIDEYEKRVNTKFADIIRLIGNETQELISKEGEIKSWITKINRDFKEKNFVKAIRSMEIRTVESSNRIMQLLLDIKKFNDDYALTLGEINLFSALNHEVDNKKSIELLSLLVKEINSYKNDHLTLSDSFDLQFRITENDNDTNWVEKLANVGSEGTDILVKAMINIMLLNVFKNEASRKFKDFKLHCVMDEIGKLHPINIDGILRFANERNILLINGSPTTSNTKNYKFIYMLTKDDKNVTKTIRLIKKVQ